MHSLLYIRRIERKLIKNCVKSRKILKSIYHNYNWDSLDRITYQNCIRNYSYKRMTDKNITATFKLENVMYSMSRYALMVSYVALTLD